MSAPMNYDDLRSILVEAAGEAEGVDLESQEIIDTDLYLLGYDSLALMEMGARIQQRFGVDIPDEEVTELRTFRTILNRVNSADPARQS
ncbi:MAG TPA: acyl carrier protein [Streptomyces sp.]